MTLNDIINNWIAWSHRNTVGDMGGNKPIDFNAEVDRFEQRFEPIAELAEPVESIYRAILKSAPLQAQIIVAVYFGGSRHALRRKRVSKRYVEQIKQEFEARLVRELA